MLKVEQETPAPEVGPKDDEPKPVEQVQENKDPAAQAAHAMPAMLGWFKNLVEEMTGVGAKRVLTALIEAPFNEKEPHFTTQTQSDAYQLGMRIENGKFIILMASLRDAQQKKTEESEKKEEKKEGESNGN